MIKTNFLYIVLLILVIIITACQPSSDIKQNTLSIAVAANFTAPMKEIALEFEKETDYKLAISFGSSGKLFAQIQNNAPFEVFLSADTDKPEKLIQANMALAESHFTYALGTLVLWSIQPDLIDDEASILKTGHFKHIALANPRLAPYGQAAIETLENLKVFENLKDKFVQGENIAQTHQFIATGNAELGFIALSQIIQDMAQDGSSYWTVPSMLYTPIRQDAVILKKGESNPIAKIFIEYLQSDKAKAIIQAYGYTL